jgi:hypothetical protein
VHSLPPDNTYYRKTERRNTCSVIRENPVYTDSNSVVKENPVGKELPNDVTPKFLGGSRDRRLLDN